MRRQTLFLNGVHGIDGAHLFAPLSLRRLARHLSEERLPSLDAWRGTVPDVDLDDLASAGWGVVFAHGSDSAIREALGDLLEHRKRQASRNDGQRYRELAGSDGVRPGETKRQFLARHGCGPGPVRPGRLPYYLLLVGGPESIPYTFERQLAVQYGVGRLCFDDPEEYAAYARNVLAAETAGNPRPRRVKLFAVENSNDKATGYSSRYLVTPLAAGLARDRPLWQVETVRGALATKSRLARLLGGAETPAVLFTASHGLGFPCGHPRQQSCQGALLCQEWPGPQTRCGRRCPKPLSAEHYFAAHDVADDADLSGMMVFCFACYGGGVPRWDGFERDRNARKALAPKAFVSRLPQRLLSHPRGALAVVAHVDRAWGYSFYWTGAGEQPQTFETALKRLLDGRRIGAAMACFGERHAELASELTEELELTRLGRQSAGTELAALWIAHNDARGYTVLGDPAVRLLT